LKTALHFICKRGHIAVISIVMSSFEASLQISG